MKKIITLCTMLCVFLLGAVSASAMDSATLLNNPGRYRVVSTQADGVVYIDTESIRSMQTRDYPNSIENIACTLYVEKYNSSLDAMAFQKGQIIGQINEYTATIHGDKRENAYALEADLTNVYTPAGLAYDTKVDTILFKNVKELFINAHRMAQLAKAN